jgi:hypothetical protein
MQILFLIFITTYAKVIQLYFRNFLHNKVFQLSEQLLSQLTLFNFDAFVLQKLAKFLNLLLELSDDFGVGIFVDDGFADDCLGSVGVSEKNKE